MKTTIILLMLLTGCSANKDKVKEVLEAEGCSNINVGEASVSSVFGCGKDDSFSNTFSCTRNTKQVSGYVCSGFLKGYTVRYE